MHLLDLPLELFQDILLRAIEARGIKRGLRLRLLNFAQATFSKQVVHALFTFRLLDNYFSSVKSRGYSPLPSFAASYLEYRVLNESDDGPPALLYIRRIAERLCQEDAESTRGRSLQTYVKQICSAVVEIQPHRMADMFTTRGLEFINYDDHIYVAAVYTQTMSIVRRHISEGREAYVYSWIFGNASDYVVKFGIDELLGPLMSDPVRGVIYGRRRSLLIKAARAGCAETVRFIYNFGIQERPWICSADRNFREAYRTQLWLKAMKTPNPEIWEFFTELRKIHLDINEFTPKDLTPFLVFCAGKGWAGITAHLIKLGAWVNEPSTQNGSRPLLIYACEKGHLGVVEILLAHGANTSESVEAASRNGHFAIIAMLLEHGADTRGALKRAVAGSYRDVAELLLNHGADPNDGSQTFLPCAIESEHVPLFRLMIERGARLDEETSANCVKRARETGQESMLDLLREIGVEVDDIGITPPSAEQ